MLARCPVTVGLYDYRSRAPRPLEFPLLVSPQNRRARPVGRGLGYRVDGGLLPKLGYRVGGGLPLRLGLVGLYWKLQAQPSCRWLGSGGWHHDLADPLQQLGLSCELKWR